MDIVSNYIIVSAPLWAPAAVLYAIVWVTALMRRNDIGMRLHHDEQKPHYRALNQLMLLYSIVALVLVAAVVLAFVFTDQVADYDHVIAKVMELLYVGVALVCAFINYEAAPKAKPSTSDPNW